MLRHARDCNRNLNVNLIKNSPKTPPKALPNDLPNDQFWTLKRSLGPYGNQDLKFDPNLWFQGLPRGTLLEALDTPSGLIYTKTCKKWRPKTMHETHHEIMRILNPPEPQKNMFYYSKAHIFTNRPGHLKVHKMIPKWIPKSLKGLPKPPGDPQRRSKRTIENCH